MKLYQISGKQQSDEKQGNNLAVTIESLTNTFLFLWLEAPDRHPYPDDPDTILNILFKGLVDP